MLARHRAGPQPKTQTCRILKKLDPGLRRGDGKETIDEVSNLRRGDGKESVDQKIQGKEQNKRLEILMMEM
jgi:hypothetical protein